MEPKDSWVFFKDIDWNCPKNNRFNIDTRDFHVGYLYKKELHPDWNIISKYKHFFHTETELKDLIERLHEESGGVGKWRMLSLISEDKRVNNWLMKYLRIFRTEKGFVVCNSDYKALTKQLLSCNVNKKHLSHH